MKHSLAAFVAAAVLGAGCGPAAEERPMKIGLGVPDGYVQYEPITAPDLYLDLIGKPVLYAGEDGTLIFSLRNAGTKEVVIKEWFRNEPENLKLRVQPYLPGMTGPDPEAWIELEEPVQKPVIHYPLTLMPDNQAMIVKHLDFVGKMRVTPGMERRFFLQAQLNLKSLNLATGTIVLRIIPKPMKETK